MTLFRAKALVVLVMTPLWAVESYELTINFISPPCKRMNDIIQNEQSGSFNIMSKSLCCGVYSI